MLLVQDQPASMLLDLSKLNLIACSSSVGGFGNHCNLQSPPLKAYLHKEL